MTFDSTARNASHFNSSVGFKASCDSIAVKALDLLFYSPIQYSRWISGPVERDYEVFCPQMSCAMRGRVAGERVSSGRESCSAVIKTSELLSFQFLGLRVSF